jgi:UTP--glucose-1-phosphate uridylyltransferase
MIRKAVIPAAGLGTRFLPASKSQPKEMLPIVDTPVIQYVVEEAAAAGVTDILMIIGKGKRAIEEHFDRNWELEVVLEQKGLTSELESIRRLSDLANIHFVWQKEAKGLGDAVLQARHHVGREPFLLLLGDTVFQTKVSVSKALLDLYERFNETIVALERVAPHRLERYGVIGGTEVGPGLYLLSQLVEKPKPDEAPSRLAIASRYALSPAIFDCLDRTPAGRNGEVQLTDALQLMLQTSAIYGHVVEGVRYDIGNKLDFLKANLMYGLGREDIQAELKAFLKEAAGQL